MTHINYLAFAIPAFFIFLYLEYQLARHLNKTSVFKYESSVSNLSIGIAERLLNLFISGSFYSLFYWIYQHHAIFKIPNVWWVWVLLILVTDLVWYWYHRLGHQVNVLWAAHIVHHQSEEFNLTVAARITVFQALIRNLFWCAIPFLGFHPAMVITILMVHGAYSFFTHTQLVNKIPWLEYILITPALHGIHHASDEKYLDKNYGDVFVFWDKLFGTFQKEEEKPNFGLTHPVKSYSFLWQHFHYYLELLEACRRAPAFKDKLQILFGSPATLDQQIRPSLEKRYLQHKANQNNRFKFRGYLNLQVLSSVLLLTLTTAFYSFLDVADKLFVVLFILCTLVNCGALMEQRRWIYYLEHFRIFILFTYIFWKAAMPEFTLLAPVVLILIERTFNMRQLYLQYVLRYEER
ncbi:sterol desaturase-related protein [Pedobacter sp. BAL39]|uniref:sterol desaturase family protein n=1 Tax=Pedobacter sp. BAL39 TaxID=391596 RepID=UPI000155938D|nr:sterol desaturase family protein [Pedobacter sp. BAL39]EDM38828.1 sterol desaturase-related protein [Pedobacter sp. BAL39]